jgi:phosphosulfolactate synthase (CoM biosynthesis protein A)
MDVKGLEELIREVVVKYMDVEKHGGKVLVIRNNEVREFTDIVSARRAALSMTGIVLLIQVPSRDEVDDAFLRFLRVHRSS